jgi:hypothetical protein
MMLKLLFLVLKDVSDQNYRLFCNTECFPDEQFLAGLMEKNILKGKTFYKGNIKLGSCLYFDPKQLFVIFQL